MINIRIRKETIADIYAIETVNISVFLNAPHTDHTEQFIVNALHNVG